jgi:hypothetical protein
MEVLYNYFENLSRNNFDDGNIDIDIDVNNLSVENPFLKPAGALVINSNSSENFINLLFKTAENIFTNK